MSRVAPPGETSIGTRRVSVLGVSGSGPTVRTLVILTTDEADCLAGCVDPISAPFELR